MQSNRRAGLCGRVLASQAAVPAASAGLGVLALDPSRSAGLAGMGDPGGARRRGDAPPLFVWVVIVFMVGCVSLEKVLTSKSLATDAADEPLSEGMCLDMACEMLWPRVSLLTMSALIKSCAWSRCRTSRLRRGIRLDGSARWVRGRGPGDLLRRRRGRVGRILGRSEAKTRLGAGVGQRESGPLEMTWLSVVGCSTWLG